MFKRIREIALACAAVLAMGNTCSAGDTSGSGSAGSFAGPNLSFSPPEVPHLMDAGMGSRKPLMMLMDSLGVGKWMDDHDLSLYGYAQGSYTYNFNRPKNGINDLRLFDFKNERFLLNQVDLTFEKVVDMSKPGWNVGFRVEGIFGSDSATMQSNGLNPYGGSAGMNHSPENQFTLLQAYADVLVPVGSGLLVRVGKFFTLLGYESYLPIVGPGSVNFFSRDYIFNFGLPFTQSGVLATYKFGREKNIAVTAGFTRGWDQATRDVNGAIDFTGSVNWIVNDKFTFLYSDSTGPQGTKNGDWRHVSDVCLYYKPDPKGPLLFGGNGIIGWESRAAAGNRDAWWYAFAGFGSYKLNDNFTAKIRAEVFRDEEGVRFFNTNGQMFGNNVTAYEVTVGMDVIPLPKDKVWSNFILRPEVRVDFANRSIFDISGGGKGKSNQVTFGIDAVFNF